MRTLSSVSYQQMSHAANSEQVCDHFKQFYPQNGLTELTSYMYIIKCSFTKQNVCLYNKSFQCICLELKTQHSKLTSCHTVNRETKCSSPIGFWNTKYDLLSVMQSTLHYLGVVTTMQCCTTRINIGVTLGCFLVLSVQ